MIQITAKKDGFRRCGVAHPKTATEYPDDRFDEDELKILKAEPLLVVEVIKSGSSGKLLMSAQETVEKIKAAETIAEVGELAKGDDRKNVVAAADKRRKELTQ